MKIQKLIALGLLTCLVSAGTVSAASVSASISATQTSSRSSNMYLSKTTGTNLSGKNNVNSYNRGLYMEQYKAIAGIDPQIDSVLLRSGQSGSRNIDSPTSNHYVHLDPAGPMTAGTNGYATLKTR